MRARLLLLAAFVGANWADPVVAQVQPTVPVASKAYVDSGLATTASAILAESTRAKAAEAGLLPLGGAADAATVKGSGWTVARTLSAILGENANAMAYGAKGDGATNDAPALASLFSGAAGRQVRIPAGSYNLGSSVTPRPGGSSLTVDPGAAITGTGLLKLDNFVPYQGSGVSSRELRSFAYTSPVTGVSNIFQSANFAKSTITTPVVAHFSEGEAAAPNSIAWGYNGVGVCSATNSNCWGMEIDIDNLVPDAHSAIGLMIDAAGYYPSDSALRIQSNNSSVYFKNGIVFWPLNNNPAISLTGSAILMSQMTAGFALYAPNSTFTNSEIDLPSFRIGATPTSINSRVLVSGSPSGAPSVAAVGTGTTPATAASLGLKSLGTGSVSLGTGGGTGFVLNDSGGTTANYLFANGSVAGSQVLLGAGGTDTNVSLSVRAQRGGKVLIGASSNGTFAQFGGAAASTVNYLSFAGSAAGSPVVVGAAGTDTNIDLRLTPQNSGQIDIFGTPATTAATPSAYSASKYLPIKVNGTTYYLALSTAAW